MRISSRDEPSIRVLTRNHFFERRNKLVSQSVIQFVTLMSKRSGDYSGRPAKRVMRRAPAGTYQTYARATRGLPYARSKATPPETKYFDTAFTGTVAAGADWTGTEIANEFYITSDGTTVGAYTASALIPSAIGAGYGQVNGSKYFLKKIRIKGQVVPTVRSDQADVIAATAVRIMLVQDMQPNGAQAQGEDIVTDLGTTFEAHYSFLAMAAGAGGRFRILKEKNFLMQPATAGTDGASTMSTSNTGAQFKLNYTWKTPVQVMLKANSSTPTTASLSNCNVFMIAHATAAISPVINGASRAYYCD